MKTKTRSLDRIDLKILSSLQDNARISYVELASQVGLSTTPCLERVKRLERAGIIRGYKAVLDPAALKANLLVFVEISLETQSPAVFDEFRRAVTKLPQIQECHLVSGQFDANFLADGNGKSVDLKIVVAARRLDVGRGAVELFHDAFGHRRPHGIVVAAEQNRLRQRL